MRAGQPRFLGVAQVGQAEIDNLIDTLPGRKLVRHDVGGLEVAVHDAEVVRKLQGRAERRDNRLHFGEGHPALGGNLLLHGGPVEQLHDQERVVLVVHVEVENRDDVRMAQARAGAALAKETVARTRRAVLAANDLDGDFVAEERPARPVDRTHPPFGEQRQNLVAIVEDLPGGEHGVN